MAEEEIGDNSIDPESYLADYDDDDDDGPAVSEAQLRRYIQLRRALDDLKDRTVPAYIAVIYRGIRDRSVPTYIPIIYRAVKDRTVPAYIPVIYRDIKDRTVPTYIPVTYCDVKDRTVPTYIPVIYRGVRDRTVPTYIPVIYRGIRGIFLPETSIATNYQTAGDWRRSSPPVYMEDVQSAADEWSQLVREEVKKALDEYDLVYRLADALKNRAV